MIRLTAAAQTRRGFALLGVLWVVIALSVVALEMGRISQRAQHQAMTARDRIVERWLAEGCLARFRSVANGVFANDPLRGPAVWKALDRVLHSESGAVLVGCDLSLHPTGRIVLDRASTADLDTLPGMTAESIARILQMQQAGIAITSLVAIEKGLTPPAKALFDAHYTDLLQSITVEPDAWVVRARSETDTCVMGFVSPPVNIEAQLVRSGGRVTIARWVEW